MLTNSSCAIPLRNCIGALSNVDDKSMPEYGSACCRNVHDAPALLRSEINGPVTKLLQRPTDSIHTNTYLMRDEVCRE